jgi:CheY-like chemotaxis protein
MSNHPLKVLLVEDKPESAGQLTNLMKSAGYEVTVANGCDAARAFARQHQFNVVVCDIERTYCHDCQVLCDTLEERANTAIAITEQGLEVDLKRAKLAGFKSHISRPFAVDALLEVIQGPGER